MRVLMLYQHEKLPSSRVRIIQLVPWLEQQGIQCTLHPYHLNRAKQATDYDAVIIQKKLLSLWDYYHWKRTSTPIIFDFDDAIYLRSTPRRGQYTSRGRQFRFNTMLNLSSHVVAGNRTLANASLNKPTHVIPSPVPDDVPQHDYSDSQSRLVRIGWIGTKGNFPMLDSIIPDLEATYRKASFELHVICNQPYTRKTFLSVIHRPWSLETQDALVSKLDIGLMPLENTPWARGKCSYKLLQYMAANVAAVGSDLGMNSDIINDQVNGVLVKKDWTKALLPLIADAKLRQQLAQRGRQTVLDHYTYKRIAQQWIRVLTQL